MMYKLKLAALAALLAVLVTACGGAAPTATPTTAPKALATATAAPAAATAPALPYVPTATKAAVATATAAPAQATATTAPAQPTASTAPTATKPAATPTQAAAELAAGNIPDAIINAQKAVLKQKGVRMRTTITLAGGEATVNIIEFMLPDRVHVTGATNEIIAIRGVGLWMKQTGGQWQKLPANDTLLDSMMSAMDAKNLEDTLKDLSIDKFKSLGTELLDGKPMRVYQYTTTMKIGDLSSEGTTKLWIGVADGLPYKSEGDSTTAGTKSTVTTAYEYGSDIKIEAPM
jgi:hypothetical protein